MRVISGKYRGRRIDTIAGKNLRPTMGIAREAVFNILTHGEFLDFLKGAHVLDLFCGCGALSMEALSRGASHVTLMDIDPKHLSIARENLQKVAQDDEMRLMRGDSSNPPIADRPCDVIFLDPPYGKGLVEKSLKKILQGGWIQKGSVIVIEMEKRASLTYPEGFEELKDRTYGVSRIVFLRWVGDA